MPSNNTTYNINNVRNLQVNEKISGGEVNVNKFESNSETQQSVSLIKNTLDKLANQHPNLTEPQANEIVDVEFTALRTQNPMQWGVVVQQLLNKERWCNGGRAALISAAEHFSGNNVIYKAVLAFLDKFSESSHQD